jgi:hypothetical protein
MLTAGSRLGPYEVTAQIGEGGMGQVYRATDTKLGRQVAIKILPDVFAADSERLARFEREAKTLASLNHPHIAGIYAVEEGPAVEGPAEAGRHRMRALVMGFVEGDDLSRLIARGAIPLDEALPIAKQIADALEAAHEQGSCAKVHSISTGRPSNADQENVAHPTSTRSNHEKHDQPVISKTMFRDRCVRGVADGDEWPRAPRLEGAVSPNGGRRSGSLRRMGWDAPSASDQQSDGSLGSDRARGDDPS